MLPLVPKHSSARLLLEEGFLPPLGSQVFEGFDLAAGSMVSVRSLDPPHCHTLVYGQFEVRGLWQICYGFS